MQRRVVMMAITASMLLTGCSAGGSASPGANTPAQPADTSPQSPNTLTTTASGLQSTTTAEAVPLVVVLDPGRNGDSGSHAAEISKQVPAGRGRTKACNITGTSTNAGYPEHAFTFDVAQRVGAALTAHGIKVVYTRPDDSGVGPCVDERAAIGNSANAAAVVSIHGDGSNSAGAKGFHVAYSSPPLNAQQGEPSTRLAKVLRDGLRSSGFATANYIAQDGLAPRDDLAGLNLSARPAVLIECGNMRNASEAAAMSSAEGRQSYAAAIAAAIRTYLGV